MSASRSTVDVVDSRPIPIANQQVAFFEREADFLDLLEVAPEVRKTSINASRVGLRKTTENTKEAEGR